MPPALIAFVLGPQFEMSINQMALYRGDQSWFSYIMSSPIALCLFGVTTLLLFLPHLQRRRQKERAAN